MKAIKNILFTFDYELFLGERSGSVEKCMLEPTRKLIELFDAFKIKSVIFFVDTTYLLRLKKQAQTSELAASDFEKIKLQLQELITKEHYVFPHIHPHWADAFYVQEENFWKLSNISKYRFHALSESERQETIENSLALLQEIIMPIKPNYKHDSYRAGGWCIQPFSDFYPHFKKFGIQNDFSVLPGIKNLSTAQYYDFENAPKNHIYKFENDILIEDEQGYFKEYAISVLNIPTVYQIANKFLLKLLWKTGNRSIGDGNGVVANAVNGVDKSEKQNLEMLSMELLTQIKLPLYLNLIHNKTLLHFISHPKMLSPHNFSCFEKFLKAASSAYSIQSDFRKMS